MKVVALQDRPREKLARAGVSALGNNELVALLLGTGTRARSALMVAQDVLDASGGVRGLTQITADELTRVVGVGQPRAARLLAAVELGRRVITSDSAVRQRLGTPREVGDYLLPRYGGYREERFGLVMLDARNRLIRSEIISVGTLDTALAHPREIFRTAILASASKIVVFHNHPTGDPLPSAEDHVLTRQLAAAGRVIAIDVVDHMILGHTRWFSFRQAGAL